MCVCVCMCVRRHFLISPRFARKFVIYFLFLQLTLRNNSGKIFPIMYSEDANFSHDLAFEILSLKKEEVIRRDSPYE